MVKRNERGSHTLRHRSAGRGPGPWDHSAGGHFRVTHPLCSKEARSLEKIVLHVKCQDRQMTVKKEVKKTMICTGEMPK